MGFVVLFVLAALVLVTALALARAIAGTGRGTRTETIVATAVLAQCIVIAPVYLLSPFRAVGAPGIAALVVIGCTFALAGMIRQSGSPGAFFSAQREQASGLWALVADLRRAVKHSPVPLWPVVLATALFFGWLMLTVGVSPPLGNNDALFYHEPIVAFTLQEGHIGPYSLPPHLQRINGMPRFCHFTHLFFAAFTGRSLVELPNILSLPVGAIATYGLMRKVGTQKSTALLWALSWPLLPGVVRLTSGIMVDVQSAMMITCATYATLAMRLTVPRALVAALAVGLTVGTKYHNIVITVVLALALAARLWALRPAGQRADAWSAKRLWPTMVTCASIVIGATCLHYLKNAIDFGNPIWPAGFSIPPLGIHVQSAHDLKNVLTSGKGLPLYDVFDRWMTSPYSVQPWQGGSARPEDYGIPGRYLAWPMMLIAALLVPFKLVQHWRSKRPVPAALAVMGVVSVIFWLCMAGLPSIVRGRYWLAVFALFFVAAGWLLSAPRHRLLARQLAFTVSVLMIISAIFNLRRGETPTPQMVYERLKVPAEEWQFTARPLSHVDRGYGLVRAHDMGPGTRLVFDTGAYSIGVLWNDDYSNTIIHASSGPIAKATALGAEFLFLHRKKVPPAYQAAHGWEAVGPVLKRKGRHPGTLYRRRPAALEAFKRKQSQ